MKKRAMKKYIPKNTLYCYSVKDNKIQTCKWWVFRKDKGLQMSGYCKYLKSGDWEENGTTLLFDKCKECEVSS